MTVCELMGFEVKIMHLALAPSIISCVIFTLIMFIGIVNSSPDKLEALKSFIPVIQLNMALY